MAKRSTPKKQQAKSQSSRRYKAFANRARKQILGKTVLNKCPKCKEDKLSHTVCPGCGYYKNISVIDKQREMDKITKVKA